MVWWRIYTYLGPCLLFNLDGFISMVHYQRVKNWGITIPEDPHLEY